MPRRNNRKRYKGEGYLGFNPNKYIGKTVTADRTGDSSRANTALTPSIQRVAFVSRPHYERHKAHSDNRRKRRAMESLRKMRAETENALSNG